MAGLVIHVAIAQEYLKKHKEKNEEEFIKGVIAPDLTNNKIKSHYGKTNQITDLKNYLQENELNTSYQRGYFLHLLTDCLFYTKYFPNLTKSVYDDYDKLNKSIIEKYNVKIPKGIEKYAQIKTGKPEQLQLEKINKLIQEISDMNIEEEIQKMERRKQ